MDRVRPLKRNDCDAPTLLDRLRIATHDVHDRLHRHPVTAPLISDDLTPGHYIGVLKAFYGFYGPCEARLGPSPFASRAAWLARDLTWFGIDPDTVPTTTDLPALDRADAVWGYHYVSEGSALGSRVISRGLRNSLSVSAETGGRFFEAYGETTGTRWRRFRALLTARTEYPDAVIDGACATFSALEQWLSHCWERETP